MMHINHHRLTELAMRRVETGAGGLTWRERERVKRDLDQIEAELDRTRGVLAQDLALVDQMRRRKRRGSTSVPAPRSRRASIERGPSSPPVGHGAEGSR